MVGSCLLVAMGNHIFHHSQNSINAAVVSIRELELEQCQLSAISMADD